MKDKKLFENNQGAFLISNNVNVEYLTGFSGSFGWVLVQNGEMNLITDSRYTESAEKLGKKGGFRVLDVKNIQKIAENITSNLHIEPSVTLGEQKRLHKVFSGAELVVMEKNRVEMARERKNLEETKNIKQAARHTDAVVGAFWAKLQEGMTEKEAAWILEMDLRQKGKYELAFAPIVAFGRNTSLPHHNPNNTKLTKNDPILVDCGAKYAGYCSDMTRCAVFGQNKAYEKLHNDLLEVQKGTIQQISQEKDWKSVAEFCRARMKAKNEAYEKDFGHGLGHGVGLQIHEAPNVSKKSKDEIKKGQIITIEPGIYQKGVHGVRIEDLIHIKEDKNVEMLSALSKKLVIINA